MYHNGSLDSRNVAISERISLASRKYTDRQETRTIDHSRQRVSEKLSLYWIFGRITHVSETAAKTHMSRSWTMHCLQANPIGCVSWSPHTYKTRIQWLRSEICSRGCTSNRRCRRTGSRLAAAACTVIQRTAKYLFSMETLIFLLAPG